MATPLRVPSLLRPVTATAVLGALAGALVLSSCAGPSRAAEAADLRRQLLDRPGVTDVRLTYSEPKPLDSGKVLLEVTMADDAEQQAVADVVTSAYAAFSDVHHDEEGDVDVTVGDDVLHLRTYRPGTDEDVVSAAVDDALEVMAFVPVLADITTQDVEEAPHIRTNYTVTVADADRRSVLATLNQVQERFEGVQNAWWRISSPGDQGWRLAGDGTFPTVRERDLFEALARDLPPGTEVGLEGRFAYAYAPADITPDAASALARTHLEVLDGDRNGYHLEQGDALVFWVTDGECWFDDGAVGRRLEQELAPTCSAVVPHEE